MGAYLVLFPGNKIKAVVPLVFFWTTISVPVFVFLLIWFFTQVLSLGLSDMVAYSSHIGGFLFGAITMSIWKNTLNFYGRHCPCFVF